MIVVRPIFSTPGYSVLLLFSVRPVTKPYARRRLT
jgi:hypothetical protein